MLGPGDQGLGLGGCCVVGTEPRLPRVRRVQGSGTVALGLHVFPTAGLPAVRTVRSVLCVFYRNL